MRAELTKPLRVACVCAVNESLIKNTLDVELESGSVLFFHDLTLHASNPNSNGVRIRTQCPHARARTSPGGRVQKCASGGEGGRGAH